MSLTLCEAARSRLRLLAAAMLRTTETLCRRLAMGGIVLLVLDLLLVALLSAWLLVALLTAIILLLELARLLIALLSRRLIVGLGQVTWKRYTLSSVVVTSP